MSKRAINSIAILVVVVGVALLTLMSGLMHGATGETQLKIAVSGSRFVLADATDWQWDRVHVFRPYDDEKFIDESLGFRWSHSAEAADYSEGYNVLVFVKDKQVTAWTRVPRNEFEFEGDKPGSAVARADAVFALERRPGQSTLLRLEKR